MKCHLLWVTHDVITPSTIAQKCNNTQESTVTGVFQVLRYLWGQTIEAHTSCKGRHFYNTSIWTISIFPTWTAGCSPRWASHTRGSLWPRRSGGRGRLTLDLQESAARTGWSALGSAWPRRWLAATGPPPPPPTAAISEHSDGRTCKYHRLSWVTL